MSRITTAFSSVTLLFAIGVPAHVVERGDTLSHLAVRYDVTVRDIAEANGIEEPDRIFVGQELVIPQSAVADGPVVHVVQRGETLSGIALRHDTSVRAIAAINGIADADRIGSGTRLFIGPEPPVFEATTGGTSTHVVERGETLGAIALRHGVKLSALVEANGIRNPDLVISGSVLTVPLSPWVCPVPSASLRNDWAFPRSEGRSHEGTDLFAEKGTPVLASVSGRVERETGERGGQQYNLTGDDGHLYIGSHLDAFGASGRVYAGQVVGYVGSTGNAAGTPPHVHFEIHPDGVLAINPYPTLAQFCS